MTFDHENLISSSPIRSDIFEERCLQDDAGTGETQKNTTLLTVVSAGMRH